MLALRRLTDGLSLFPHNARPSVKREEEKAMKILEKTLLSIAMVIGLSVGVHAQKDGRRPPKKDPPPVVTPQPKNPPGQRPPSDGKKPKKPSSAILFWKSED